MPIVIEAFSLGLIGGIIPGSVLTILLISVMQGGFRAGLRAFFWSLAAEMTVVGLLLLALFTLPIPQVLFNYIGLLGALVLFYFAWQILHIQKIDRPEQGEQVFSGKEIYALAATNAPLYVFWLTVCAPLIFELSREWSLWVATSSFMMVFEVGWSLATFVIMLLFVKGRHYLTNPIVMGRVYMGASLLMFGLGLRMIYLSLSLLGVI